MAELMARLLFESKDNAIVAMQLAFDLFDNENQQLSTQVCQHLVTKKYAEPDDKKKEDVQKLIDIVVGKVTHEIYREFLFKNNKTDGLIMSDIKDGVPQNVSVLLESCVWANGIMNACTTDDSFLKTNLDWVAKSSNWSKFSCTSTLGMIHKGNKQNAMTILNPYLVQSHASSSPYSAGGAYYALGLIHANQYNSEVINTFIQGMNSLGSNDVICHGICLGYGLVGMATAEDGIYNELKSTMFGDSAVRGEAAALGAGLIMLGSGNEDAIKDMLTYAHETQHEKIIRSISLGLAFIMYGKEEAADVLFDQMVGDKDAIIRYGAMYLLGMAYVGTENKTAIRKLLHYGVSDVDNDVRRGAVTNLGFVLAKSPEKVNLFCIS
jgi:26S proteasome regulatory subunit N2